MEIEELKKVYVKSARVSLILKRLKHQRKMVKMVLSMEDGKMNILLNQKRKEELV